MDTEGSFTCHWCEDMAIGARRKLEEECKMRCSEEERESTRVFREQYVFCGFDLKRIHVFSVTVAELLACLDHMGVCQGHPKVKLVVVDSIAFHFRQDFDDMALRASILAKTTNNLMSLRRNTN